MLDFSADDSLSLLKERDYIGLSESSSGPSKLSASSQVAEDALESTDLHLDLDLGLGLATGSSMKDDGGEHRELQGPKQANGSLLCGTGSTVLKKWMKRGFSETLPTLKSSEQDSALSKESSFVPVWASSNPKVPAWCSAGLDGTSSRIHTKGTIHSSQEGSRNCALEDAPPAKDQVVGWPPVRSYRRQTLAKPAEMFVKVNMDGITVGRKVDLNAYSSYESLLGALEEMFHPSSSVSPAVLGREPELKHFLLAKGSDFVLTYEDKDGDWMLVGDVPWGMFVSTVRRLRITRGMEATGSGTKLPETSRLHA